MDASISNRRVFVGNLAFETTWQDLKDHFGGGEQRVFAKLLPRGCGIVEFQTAAAAAAAIAQFHGTALLGRNIVCRADRYGQSSGGGVAPRDTERKEVRRPVRDRPATAPSLKVYVGNVPWSATSGEIGSLISERTNLTPRKLVLPRDRRDRARGFAVATFGTIDEASTVVQALAGCELAGRALHVRFDQFPDDESNGGIADGRK